MQLADWQLPVHTRLLASSTLEVGMLLPAMGFFAWIVVLVEVTKTVPLEKLVWGSRKDPDNERQRYTTEQKIRILREAESSDKTIQDVVVNDRSASRPSTALKRDGMLEVDQAKQLKELQRENASSRMLADEMLGKLLKEALEKVMSPGHKRQIVEELVAGDVARLVPLVGTTACIAAPLLIRRKNRTHGWLV